MCDVTPTPLGTGCDSGDSCDKLSEKSSLRAVKTEIDSNVQKRLDNPDSVSTVSTIRTTSQGEREAALRIDFSISLLPHYRPMPTMRATRDTLDTRPTLHTLGRERKFGGARFRRRSLLKQEGRGIEKTGEFMTKPPNESRFPGAPPDNSPARGGTFDFPGAEYQAVVHYRITELPNS